MIDLETHLQRYGIEYMRSFESWDQIKDRLGNDLSERIRQADELRDTEVEFYDFIASDLNLAGLFHSERADRIRQSGCWIDRQCQGRLKICDVGCNSGYLTTWYALADERRRVLGVDRCQRSIALAQSQAEALGVGNVRFVQADVLEEIPGGPFDAVVESQALHESHDWPKALRKIRSVLRDDGIFVSVAVLETARDARRFADALQGAGLCLASWQFVRYSDLEQGAFPALVATTRGTPLQVDFDKEYGAMLRILESG
jgi:ubiquinone/menaquinone biosynthesis C-methylase UbiE